MMKRQKTDQEIVKQETTIKFKEKVNCNQINRNQRGA